MNLHRRIDNGAGDYIDVHNNPLLSLRVLSVLCGFHLVLPPSTFRVSAAAAWAAARRAVSTRNGEQET